MEAIDYRSLTTKVKLTLVSPTSQSCVTQIRLRVVFYKQNQGDVLINYENEILLARQRGETEPYIIPATNISIDTPVAVVDKNVDKHGTRRIAEAFVRYLYTPEAQREFAKVGFRPVNSAVASEFSRNFPRINNLFTVASLGGWNGTQTRFFADGAVFDQIQTALNRR